MTALTVPHIPPTGLIDPTTARRHPIDNAQRFYVSNVRQIEKACLYHAGAQKLGPGSWAGRLTVLNNTKVTVYRKIPRTMYTQYAVFTCIYGTDVLSAGGVSGTIKVDPATGPQISITLQNTDSIEIEDLFIVSEIIEIGAGDNTDNGLEEVEIEFDNTASPGPKKNLIVFAWDITPQAMLRIEVPTT